MSARDGESATALATLPDMTSVAHIIPYRIYTRKAEGDYGWIRLAERVMQRALASTDLLCHFSQT